MCNPILYTYVPWYMRAVLYTQGSHSRPLIIPNDTPEYPEPALRDTLPLANAAPYFAHPPLVRAMKVTILGRPIIVENKVRLILGRGHAPVEDFDIRIDAEIRKLAQAECHLQVILDAESEKHLAEDVVIHAPRDVEIPRPPVTQLRGGDTVQNLTQIIRQQGPPKLFVADTRNVEDDQLGIPVAVIQEELVG